MTEKNNSFRKLIETLKPMTFRQRVEHIWMYYNLFILVGIFALIIVVYFAAGIINSQVKPIYAGVYANLEITEEGKQYLQEDYFTRLGGGDWQKVELTGTRFNKLLSSVQDYDYNYNAAMSAVALVGSYSLDYLLMDQIAMEFYMSQDIFMDLRDFFTEQELEKLKDDLVYLETNAGERIPVALHIEDMPFAVDCIDLKDNIFLAFVGNTKRMDTCRDFWEYLNNWKKK